MGQLQAYLGVKVKVMVGEKRWHGGWKLRDVEVKLLDFQKLDGWKLMPHFTFEGRDFQDFNDGLRFCLGIVRIIVISCIGYHPKLFPWQNGGLVNRFQLHKGNVVSLKADEGSSIIGKMLVVAAQEALWHTQYLNTHVLYRDINGVDN